MSKGESAENRWLRLDRRVLGLEAGRQFRTAGAVRGRVVRNADIIEGKGAAASAADSTAW